MNASLRNVIIGIVTGIIWYHLIPKSESNFAGAPTTKVNLKKAAHYIKKYYELHHRVPHSLAEVRMMALTKNLKFLPYDGYAKRLSYRAVSKSHYILQAHVPNRSVPVTSAALGRIVQPVLAQPQYSFDAQVYPVQLLEGVKHPKGQFEAKLYRNTVSNSKTLVVRSIEGTEVYYSEHPGVEEFFWLEPELLIFTASGAKRYEDGVYFWNFKTGDLLNVLREFDQRSTRLGLGDSDQGVLMSLAAIADNRVTLFIRRGNPSKISASGFYSKDNLFEIHWEQTGKLSSFRRVTSPQGDLQMGSNLLGDQKFSRESGSKIVKRWGALPTSGDPGAVIEAWQAFAMEFPDSALFPYALLWLGYFYLDASHHLWEREHETAIRLQNFGIEINQSLSRLASSPGYILALSQNNLDVDRKQKPGVSSLSNFH